jgi:hypothetical protein
MDGRGWAIRSSVVELVSGFWFLVSGFQFFKTTAPETTNQKPQTLCDSAVHDVDNPVSKRGVLRIVSNHKHCLALRV